MSTSLFTKIAIAAAATMITLSPAMADRGHRHGHGPSYGYKVERNYQSHKHFKKHHFHRHNRFGFHKHWKKPRWYGYGYNPYRRWN